MSVFLELRRHSSFAEETVAQRHARFEGNLSEVIPTQETAGSGAITAESDEESLRPRSKLRRRWRLQATTAPITPPLFEDSPGSAGTRLSSWQLVHVDDLEVGGLALDAESSVLPAAPLLLPSHSLPPRPSLIAAFLQGITMESTFGVSALQLPLSAG